MSKAREASEDRAVLGITERCPASVSDVRLDISCSILDIENSQDENTFSDRL